MAVLGAAKTFRENPVAPFLPGLDAGLQPLLVYSFLASSAICLILVAFASHALTDLLSRKRTAATTSLVSFAGTLLVFLGGTLGTPAVVAGGVLMGLGSSVFLTRWGVAFSRFRFATSVINSAIAFALGFVAAVALINWVPAPLTGMLALLMPILMTVPFRNRKPAATATTSENIEGKYLRGYLARLIACLAFFGVVTGALRAICGTQLLSYSDIAIELVLGAGCFASVIVLVGAMIATKRETSWDSLFRIVSPVIVLGIVGLTLLTGDFALLGCFFVSLGYVCLEALLWIFLANMAKSMNDSSVFVVSLGYGVLQACSILGAALENAMANNADALSPIAFEASLGHLALILITVIAFGYAILPRYRELKALLASVVLASMIRGKRDEDGWSVCDGIVAATEIESETERAGGAAEASAASAPVAAAPSEASTTTDESTSMGDAYGAKSTSVNVEYAITATESDNEQEDDPDDAAPPQPERGSFMRRCDEIVSTYLLSEREREVLVLLAKGHNAAFIQDKLCISRSTAKTHINHIYKKLDIHTHQELLTMVEDRQRGPAARSRNAS